MNLPRSLGVEREAKGAHTRVRSAQLDLVMPAAARTTEPEEHLGNVLRLRWAGGCLMVLWALWALFDGWAGDFLEGGDPTPLLAVRFGIAPVQLVLYWRVLRSPLIRVKELHLVELVGFSLTAGAIGWMGTSFGGLASPYDHDVYIMLMTRGATLRQPWWRSWYVNLTIVLVHLAANLASSSFHPALAVQLDSSLGRWIAVNRYLAMLVAAAMMVLASHMAWAFQRRVFQARQLGQYKLDIPIGEGGHGQVWRAYHTGLNASVAVKILKGDWRPDSPQVQRFQREARATFALKHPNTVRMLDYGITVDGVCYLAMELLEGVTLAQQVARAGPLDPASAVHVVLQAANALAEAHALGIVHRDVKPENLLITQVSDDPLFCKLVDFGIARVTDDLAQSLTRTGKVIGTPGYIAPEALSGAAADPRADVFALGAVLHFALTGHAPRLFGFDGADALPAPTRIGQAAMPRDLKNILERCLSPIPAQRFADASELAAYLRRCADVGTLLNPATPAGTELAPACTIPTYPLSE